MTEPTPTWRPVVGYEDRYLVSDAGEVWSVLSDRGLSLVVNNTGYLSVGLHDGVRQQKVQVHAVVLAAFVGPRPQGQVTRHLDGDPFNNHLSNLRYGTYSENAYDRVAHGRDREARKTHCPQQHPYDATNTWIDTTSGARRCKTCMAARQRSARQRAKAVAA